MPIGNEIHAWLGGADYNGEVGIQGNSIFWKLSLDGYGYALMPMEEDLDYYCQNRSPRPVGKFLDLELPSYRVLAILNTIKRFGSEFGNGTSDYVLKITYHHTRGRLLECHNPRRWINRHAECSMDNVTSHVTGSIDSLTTNTEESAYNVLRPIYEKFSFYEFPRQIVSYCVRKMQESR